MRDREFHIEVHESELDHSQWVVEYGSPVFGYRCTTTFFGKNAKEVAHKFKERTLLEEERDALNEIIKQRL